MTASQAAAGGEFSPSVAFVYAGAKASPRSGSLSAMSSKVRLTAGDVSVELEWNDSPTAKILRHALPIESYVHTWGNEIYFPVEPNCPPAADARANMRVGEVAYWPDGPAVCVFFGRTPASGPDGQPMAASPVNVLGYVVGEPDVLRGIPDGVKIVLEEV